MRTTSSSRVFNAIDFMRPGGRHVSIRVLEPQQLPVEVEEHRAGPWLKDRGAEPTCVACSTEINSRIDGRHQIRTISR